MLDNVDAVSDSFVEFMTQAAERSFPIKTCKTSSSKKSKSKVSSNITLWFDEECHIARHKAITDGRLASLDPNNIWDLEYETSVINYL